jgi:hypothetical protein
MKQMKCCVWGQNLSCEEAESEVFVNNALSPYASRPEDNVEVLPVKMRPIRITEMDKTLLLALNLLGVATPHQLALLLEKAGLLTDEDTEELLWQRCEQMGKAQYMQVYDREGEKVPSTRRFAVTIGWRGKNALKIMGIPGLYKEQLHVLAQQHKATVLKKSLAANEKRGACYTTNFTAAAFCAHNEAKNMRNRTLTGDFCRKMHGGY